MGHPKCAEQKRKTSAPSAFFSLGKEVPDPAGIPRARLPGNEAGSGRGSPVEGPRPHAVLGVRAVVVLASSENLRVTVVGSHAGARPS